MYKQFYSVGAGVGKKVAVVGVCEAKDIPHSGEQSVGVGALAHWLRRHPYRIDRNHSHNFRNQAALASIGWVTLKQMSPCAISVSRSDRSGSSIVV